MVRVEEENSGRNQSNVEVLDVDLHVLRIDIHERDRRELGHLPRRFRELHRKKTHRANQPKLLRPPQPSDRTERERGKAHIRRGGKLTMSSSWRQTASEARPKRRTRTLSTVSLTAESTSRFCRRVFSRYAIDSSRRDRIRSAPSPESEPRRRSSCGGVRTLDDGGWASLAERCGRKSRWAF